MGGKGVAGAKLASIPENWLSIPDAAVFLGVSRNKIYDLISDGYLKKIETAYSLEGHRKFIDRDQLTHLRDHPEVEHS